LLIPEGEVFWVLALYENFLAIGGLGCLANLEVDLFMTKVYPRPFDLPR
jgi:hypothetical protein